MTEHIHTQHTHRGWHLPEEILVFCVCSVNKETTGLRPQLRKKTWQAGKRECKNEKRWERRSNSRLLEIVLRAEDPFWWQHTLLCYSWGFKNANPFSPRGLWAVPVRGSDWASLPRLSRIYLSRIYPAAGRDAAEPPPPRGVPGSNCALLIRISKPDVLPEPLRARHTEICNPKREASQGEPRRLSGCAGAGAEHSSVGQMFYMKQTQRITAVNISPHRNHLNFQLTKKTESLHFSFYLDSLTSHCFVYRNRLSLMWEHWKEWNNKFAIF